MEGTQAPILLAEHAVLCSSVSKQGSELVLGHRGGLRQDGARRDQPESSPRAPCREAEPPLGAHRTPGNCQTRPQCLGPGFAPMAPLRGTAPSPVPPVLESPESSKEQMVTKGSSVTFTCEATGSPAPAVTWLKDGEPLGWQSNRVPGGPQLSLAAVGPADTGVYSCLVANEVGEASKAFHLLVMGACLPLGIWEGQPANFLGAMRG